ncbi:autophagy protein [Grosmannia clavigera kw1407]|uniref:Autophagy protein 5 n=1 Tax=Grosmannia clavigera (strain kw1407 / UAMH 11150) TaxID=655863 RepID=F0XGR7_GROCL|nr:autophagy protein [Grosmannia clavigera kw1407]EFX03054.1 autophagy protein [Grosmannia clavigera kw1407]
MASPSMRRPAGSTRISQHGASTSAAAPGASLARILWRRRVPLLITHASLGGFPGECSDGSPSSSSAPAPAPLVFAASVPRFGYLAQLLPRLSAFFGRPCSSFQYENVPLRNLPLGLLMDLYLPPSTTDESVAEAGAEAEPATGRGGRRRLPWRLVVADGEAWHLGDTFLNGAKEADYVRYGSAKQIMSLSKANTEALWEAIQDNDYATFSRVNNLLLNAAAPLKHIPLRIFIPSTAPPKRSVLSTQSAAAETPPYIPGSYKIMQPLVAPRLGNRQPQTLGAALRNLLPLLFPSSRDPVLANVVLHGASVPFHTPLEELMREAAYPDGWLALVVVLL